MSLAFLDKQIIDAIQADFPLVERPFQRLAEALGLSEARLIERVQHMAETGVIRELGAVFDLHRLGYVSTLCAAQVDETAVAEVAIFLNAFPEVTHNYLRDHRYNLWFTLIVPSRERIEAILERVRLQAGVGGAISLPSEKTYKIKVRFSATETGGASKASHSDAKAAPPAAPRSFEAWEKRLIRVLSSPFPLSTSPFQEVAEESRLSVDQVFESIEEWRKQGVIRRFGARVNHRRIGIQGNGMSVWEVPLEATDSVAAYMVSLPEVSHCYRRPIFPDWPYSLYAMIHGASEAAVRESAAMIAQATDAHPYRVLFSSKEFKKSTPRYFTEAL